MTRPQLVGVILLLMTPILLLVHGWRKPALCEVGTEPHGGCEPGRQVGDRLSARLAQRTSVGSSFIEARIKGKKGSEEPSYGARGSDRDGNRETYAREVQSSDSHDLTPQGSVRAYSVPLIYSMDDTAFLQRFPMVTPVVLADLREGFEQVLGSGESSPDEPDYAVRWERAEMSLEDRIRVMYGWSALADYSREKANHGQAESNPP